MKKNILPPKRDLVKETAVIIALSTPEKIGKLSVSSLCEILRVSQDTLDRQFQTGLRSSVGDFLSIQRAIKAGFFIEADGDENYSVEEIAAIFGYGSAGQFSRAFEKCMATTPENYRRCKQIMEMKNGPAQNTERFYIYDFRVSLVDNLRHCGFDFAFIVSQESSYRLIACDKSDLFLIDSQFKSPVSAKAKFKKLINEKLIKDKKKLLYGDKVIWTPFNFPLKAWWADILEEIESIKRRVEVNERRRIAQSPISA